MYDDPFSSDESFGKMVQKKIRKSRKETSAFGESKNNTAKIKFKIFDDNEEENNSNDYDNYLQKQEEANERHLDYFEDYNEEDDGSGSGYKKSSKYKNKKITNVSYKSKGDRGSSNSATNYKSYNQEKNYDYNSNGNRYFNSSKNRSENNYSKRDNESSYSKRGNSFNMKF